MQGYSVPSFRDKRGSMSTEHLFSYLQLCLPIKKHHQMAKEWLPSLSRGQVTVQLVPCTWETIQKRSLWNVPVFRGNGNQLTVVTCSSCMSCIHWHHSRSNKFTVFMEKEIHFWKKNLFVINNTLNHRFSKPTAHSWNSIFYFH